MKFYLDFRLIDFLNVLKIPKWLKVCKGFWFDLYYNLRKNLWGRKSRDFFLGPFRTISLLSEDGYFANLETENFHITNHTQKWINYSFKFPKNKSTYTFTLLSKTFCKNFMRNLKLNTRSKIGKPTFSGVVTDFVVSFISTGIFRGSKVRVRSRVRVRRWVAMN